MVRSRRFFAPSMRRPGIDAELEYFNVEAVGPQKDAQGTVHVRIRHGDKLYTGHGLGARHRRGKRAGVRCRAQPARA